MAHEARPAPCGRRRNATLPTLAILGIVGIGLVVPSHRAHAEACAAWTGEPTPLPSASDPDAMLSRWASLRARELAALAAPEPPAVARRLWQHILCLEPQNPDAARALATIHAVRVVRPEIVPVPRGAGADAEVGLDDPGAPIRVAVAPAPERAVLQPRPPAPAPPPAPPDWSGADAALRETEAQIRGADFESALKGAERVRRSLESRSAVPGAAERRARAEVLAATALVALGREDAARQSFERALAANPRLVLDPARTSPKVRRVFDAARAAGEPKP